MTRFADHKYVYEFISEGRYPAIHDAIFGAVAANVKDVTAVMDLGACTGLLSARVAKELGLRVVAVEPNGDYIDRGIHTVSGVRWLQTPVTAATVGKVARAASENGVGLVMARRVLPEIAERGGIDTVTYLGHALREAGVHTIVLEGRVYSKRSTALLSHADAEVEALKEDFALVASQGNVRVLAARLP